jgi:hypothetical protein
MSPQALQRMVVRMLFDPALVEQVYSDAPVDGLSAEGRAMLTQPDRRAWATDPYRRPRALTALLEEFPASAAQAGVGKLDAFFSSTEFHQVCDARGSMALSFGTWLESLAGPVARLERALAQVRRPAEHPGTGIGLPSTVALIELPAGVIDQYQALRAQLGAHPVPHLVQGHARPIALPPSAETQSLVVQASEDGQVSLTPANPSLAALLQAAQVACSRETLEAEAVALGASAQEAGEIIDDLLSEGLLVDHSVH